MRYYCCMIKSFADSETHKIFNRERSRALPPEILERARIKLLLLNVAKTVDDLRNPPSNRLESLKGNRKGQYSIRINKQWRICFTWNDEHAYDVEIVDYH